MIFVIKQRLHEGRRSPAIILLCLCFGKISQNFHNLWNLSCWLFKSWKNRGYKGSFLAICNLNLFFLPLSQIFSYELFSSTDTRKGTIMFSGPANLGKFHSRKRDKSCLKDPYFLWYKKLLNGIELRQDLYLSMCKLSNLSPRLSHSVFFSVDPFFRCRRPRNITGAVAGNPRFHHRKNILCETVFNTPFQITIVRSYRAAVFVFMLTVLKLTRS